MLEFEFNIQVPLSVSWTIHIIVDRDPSLGSFRIGESNSAPNPGKDDSGVH